MQSSLGVSVLGWPRLFIYLLSYLCTYLPLQDKYCYYSLHVSKHMDHCQGDQRWWQGILVRARLVQLISHYPVDKWIDNTLVSVFVDSHEVWICSTFLILQIYKLQFTQVVHCKKKKYCIFIPFNITYPEFQPLNIQFY